MLGLKLRGEFLGDHMPGTAIALRNREETGAAQQGPEQILGITYPTTDVQTGLKALSSNRAARPIVLLGERGRGKSHIMAVMHHAVASPETVEEWAHKWGDNISADALKTLELTQSFLPISEPVHNHEYPLLWDLVFDRHPKGQYYRGQFEQLQQPFPPRSLLEKMFEDQPVALILDEFQKWFDGLHDDEGSGGRKWRESASNFIQCLSEIAAERPNLLILVVSCLNNSTDAYQQVHRNGPVVVDFRGPSAKQDRQNLLLYRLFENRGNIATPDITSLVSAYASERFRLLHPNKSGAEKQRVSDEVVACWPFSPELVELLEDHILMSQAAQETRDLIRILAQVFRARGEAVPVITPADFHVDDDSCGVQSLLDSIATAGDQEKLREIAQRNLLSVRDAGIPVPNARELISAIWVRSMSPSKIAGGTPAALHLDITRDQVVDDNAFQAELVLLIENSVNIHGDEVQGGPLRFGTTENPRSKVRACAKNDKLWHPNASTTAAQTTVYPARDVEHIRNTLKHILVPDSGTPASRVVVLGSSWNSDPWSEVDDNDHPSKWDRPVLLVMPEQAGNTAQDASKLLGPWLAKFVQTRRNTVRFLLLAPGAKDLFSDPDLVYTARCSYLCSKEAWGADSTYRALHTDFDRPLRNELKARFSRFAILQTWDYQQPDNCHFEVEKVTAQGTDIPAHVEERVLADLFDATEFEKAVIAAAKDADLVGGLLDELSEPPPPNTGAAIPYLGDTKIYERILAVAAKGDIVLNVNGNWIGRLAEHETDQDALRYVRTKGFKTGQEMRQVQLALPSAVGGASVTAPGGSTTQPTPQPSPTGAGTGGATTGGITTGGLPPTGGTGSQGGASPGGTGPTTGPTGGPGSIPFPKTTRTSEPKSGLNLSGCFEEWGHSSHTESTEDPNRVFRPLYAAGQTDSSAHPIGV